MNNSQCETTSAPPVLSKLHNFMTGDLKLVWGLVFLAWVLVLLSVVTGFDHVLYHPASIWQKSHFVFPQLLLLLVSWLVMIVAMMLPSSLPLIRLFSKISQQQSQEEGSPLLVVFISAYATVWTGFALLNCVSAFGLHYLVDSLAWISERPWLLSGMTLLIAGAFQFSGLKEHCLKSCRHPLSFLTHHYQRGLKATWNLGIRHGLYCLGCCWALMLVMFAVGEDHLALMLVLTSVMVVEKTSRWGYVLVPVVGIGLLVWGSITVIHPNGAWGS
jgi:predicted metal-binding membrane protein